VTRARPDELRRAPPASAPAPPGVTRVFSRLELALDPAELTRRLGYPAGAAPGPRLAADLKRRRAQALEALEPRGVVATRPVGAHTPRSLGLGEVTLAGRVAEFLAGVERVAVFVVTVGPAVSRLAAEACREGDAFGGFVLDACGSWAAEAAADALVERLRAEVGGDVGLTPRFSPGYCGMELDQQPALFRLVDAGAIGVTLSDSWVMRPEKSVSGLIGLGSMELAAVQRLPCAACSEVGCHMRRGPAR